MKNFLASIICLLTVSLASGTDFPFSGNLPEEYRKKIQQKEIVIRNLNSLKEISLPEGNPLSDSLLEEIRNLKPVYLAEVLYTIPVSEEENLLSKLEPVLTDVAGWVGIPYYSEHNEIWVDLYSSATVEKDMKSSDGDHTSREIDAGLFMEPFGNIQSHIEVSVFSNGLIFSNTNTEPIKYHDFKCIKSGKMKSLIVVYRNEGNWVLYGIGGVVSPKLPVLSKRIELSFMNRIKTFCSFAFKKISEQQG